MSGSWSSANGESGSLSGSSSFELIQGTDFANDYLNIYLDNSNSLNAADVITITMTPVTMPPHTNAVSGFIADIAKQPADSTGTITQGVETIDNVQSL